MGVVKGKWATLSPLTPPPSRAVILKWLEMVENGGAQKGVSVFVRVFDFSGNYCVEPFIRIH